MESRRTPSSAVIGALLLLLVQSSHCFNLLGATSKDYNEGDLVEVKVNSLTSITVQLPYPYYSLPYCRPPKLVHSLENFDEVLRGDLIQNSPYEFRMREPRMCNVVCRVVLNEKTVEEFKEKIDDDYRVNMMLDDLPLVIPIRMRIGGDEYRTVYQFGFPVGLKGQYNGSEEDTYFIYNHLLFTVKYHRHPLTKKMQIVGFEVDPFSVRHQYEGIWKEERTRMLTCDPHSRRFITGSESPQAVQENDQVIFSYDVEFQETVIKWAARWDAYVLQKDSQTDWFSVMSSLIIVLFLSGMVGIILQRTFYVDLSKYYELERQEALDETGWKVVHGDVFRAPSNSDLLCVFVGTGVQLLGILPFIVMLAVLGFISPSRSSVRMNALLFWAFMGYFAGYASGRLHKMFGGTEWKKIALKTGSMFPSIVFTIFCGMNILLWTQKSSGTVPLGTMFALIFLWLGISVPMVFTGSYFGFKKAGIAHPVETKRIPRQIPEQAWYTRVTKPVFTTVTGLFTFTTILVEFFYVLSASWHYQLYYITIFNLLLFIILIITCAETAIVLCYLQLRGEDYLWWWKSYLRTGSSSALWLFLYATFFFAVKLQITSMVSAMLYFGYMLIASLSFFMLTGGTVGFYACFWFTRLIYSSLKSV